MIFEREFTPVDLENRRIRRRRWFAILIVVLAVAGMLYWRIAVPVAVDYSDDTEHFKYGSIGSDTRYGGIPLRVWQVLPEMFPEYLPSEGEQYLRVPAESRDYLDAYASFGFLMEPDHVMPIGFSQRREGVDLVGLNCAVCHTSTVQMSAGFASEKLYEGKPVTVITRRTPDGKSAIDSALVLGMPANTVDLEAYFVFLFECASDTRFTPDNILNAIADRAKRVGDQELGLIEKQLLRYVAIPTLRDTLQLRRRQLSFLSLLPHPEGEAAMPRFGPGRIDTFSPYKSIQFAFPWDGTYGIADYPSIWNQRPREGMQLHWDGNNTSVFERNISASLGAGASPVSLDMHRMLRVAKWIGSPPPPNSDFGGNPNGIPKEKIDGFRDNPFPKRDELQIPRYPFVVNSILADQGKKLFGQHCAKCHGWKGERIGRVEDIREIRTDAARLDSYTEDLLANQLQLGAGKWWRFKTFRKTNGYSNAPLDGVWARAPYLHNGSVPSLADLYRRPLKTEDLKDLGVETPEKLNDKLAEPSGVRDLIIAARRRGLRPPVFYRGDDEYDTKEAGFRCDRAVGPDGRTLYMYSTLHIDKNGKVVPGDDQGNGHGGHYGKGFGSNLKAHEVAAIIEYQKKLGERNP